MKWFESLKEYLFNVFTGGRHWKVRALEVTELGRRWQAMPPKYVMVSPQDERGEVYLREMAGIYNNDQFSWFLYKVREMAVMNLTNKPIEGAQVNVGIITGVDIIAGELRKLNAQWDALDK